MTSTAPLPGSTATPERSHQARAFLVVLGVAVLHAWATWGYTGLFWGEHGRWLHALTRAAAGEIPYRDFTYTNPPFGLWVVGSLVRLVGPSYAAITAIMTGLFLVTIATYVLALRRLMPDLVLPVALPALLFAISYASRHGVPLPEGTDSMSEPIGFLCLLGAAWLILEVVERPDRRRAVGAGTLLALAMLCKHDFWGVGLYLLLAGGFFLSRRRAPSDVQAAVPVAFGIVFVSGLAVAMAQSTPPAVLHVLIGSGQALEIALRSTPSVERLVAEVAGAAALAAMAVAALWLCLAISDHAASRWAGALLLVFLTAAATHLGMSVSAGRALAESGLPAMPTLTQDAMWTALQRGSSLTGAALALFDSRFQAHLFPVIMPPLLLLVLAARWRRWHDPVVRGRVALLLGLCVMARFRRGFEGADWYQVLLELPAYALFLQLVAGPARQKSARTVRAALTLLIVLGLYTYISLAPGPGTFRGRLPATATRAGVVHWPAAAARAYHFADSVIGAIDPTGHRPVYAFGASGGWNFFLGRDNPLPWIDGLATGNPVVLDSAARRLLDPSAPAILVDNPFALRPILGPASLTSWEPAAEPSRYTRRDREWFEAVAARCRAAGTAPGGVRVYDCAGAR